MTFREYLTAFKKAALKSWTMWAATLGLIVTAVVENYFVLESVIPEKYYPYVIIIAMIIGRLKGIHVEVKNK